eukprot:c13631_g1_i1 orf=227-418(+)
MIQCCATCCCRVAWCAFLASSSCILTLPAHDVKGLKCVVGARIVRGQIRILAVLFGKFKIKPI